MRKTFFLTSLSILFIFMSLNSCKVDKELQNVKIDKTITIKVGEAANVELASNPTTGYEWAVYKNSNEKSVMFKEKKYEANSNTNNMVGAGGKEVFTFNSLKKGKATIIFKYKKNDNEIAKTVAYQIIVEK